MKKILLIIICSLIATISLVAIVHAAINTTKFRISIPVDAIPATAYNIDLPVNVTGTLSVTATTTLLGNTTLNSGAVLQVNGSAVTNGGGQWIADINQASSSNVAIISSLIWGGYPANVGVYTTSTTISSSSFCGVNYGVARDTTANATLTFPSLFGILQASCAGAFPAQSFTMFSNISTNTVSFVAGASETIKFAPGTPPLMQPNTTYTQNGGYATSTTGEKVFEFEFTQFQTSTPLWVSGNNVNLNQLSGIIAASSSNNGQLFAVGIGGGLQFVNGVLSSTITGGGGGGTPAGNVNTIQYNNGGSFGGSPEFTYNTSTGQFRLVTTAGNGAAGNSQSVGGNWNINNSNSTNTALTIYSNQGVNQSGNEVRIMCDGIWGNNVDCVNIQSLAATATTLQVTGSSTNKGVIKATLNSAGDGIDQSNASALSVLVNSTSGQGVFVTTGASGTTGFLMQIRNYNAANLFQVASASSKFGGNLTIASTTSALLLTDSAGLVSGYAGASACSGTSNFVTTISATGATTCGQAIATSTAMTAGQVTFMNGNPFIASNANFTITTGTGVFAAPSGTFSGYLDVGTTTVSGGVLFSVVNASNTQAILVTTSTTPDFALAVTTSSATSTITLGNLFFGVASSGIPYFNGTTTISIGGAALGAGACTSTATIIPLLLSTTTDQAMATPQNYPGADVLWHAYISRAGSTSSDVTTEVCEPVAGTPTASKYNVSWWRNIGL